MSGELGRIYLAVRERTGPERRTFDLREPDFPLLFEGFMGADRAPDGSPFLWMGRRAQARIRVGFSRILVEAAALVRATRLTVRIDGETAASAEVETVWTSVSIPTSRWNGRLVRLEMEVETTVVPRNEGLWEDSRELGLAVRRLESEPGPPAGRLAADFGPKPAPAALERAVVREAASREGRARGAVVIATSSISPDDAVSIDVLGMFDALAEAGYRPILWNPQDAEAQSAIERPEVPLIVHYAWHWPEGVALLERAASRRRLLRYHNVTPSDLFLRSDGQMLREAIDARERLPAAIARSTHFLAPSLTIAGDLAAAGAAVEEILYLPCFHRIETLLRVEPDAELSRGLEADPRRKLLVLGRIVPSKGIHHAIEVLGRYRETFGDTPVLHVVGRTDSWMKDYAAELRRLAERRGVAGSVAFHDSAPAPAVAAFFRHCDVLMSMSESEAFALPILEAEAFGKPVVGWNRGAKLEVAGAGQLLFASLELDLYAEALHALLTDASLFEEKAQRGRRNMESRFGLDGVRRRFLEIIDAMVEARD